MYPPPICRIKRLEHKERLQSVQQNNIKWTPLSIQISPHCTASTIFYDSIEGLSVRNKSSNAFEGRYGQY